MTSSYDDIRSTTDDSNGAGFVEERVEVNQRALIDKILARYASAGAVYRELLQNSNDAEATTAEIYFTTQKSIDNKSSEEDSSNGSSNGKKGRNNNNSSIVQQVVYRNDGMPFRPQDWSRLKKIAEGNPDVAKVGAFGVGAYTMFSICEEPVVVSGDTCLAFVWKGDALWTKRAPHKGPPSKWTSFTLPSRDPYPLPDMTEFGQFLCASLTFTKSLRLVRVLVDGVERMSVVKTLIQEPRLITTTKSKRNGRSSSSSSSWWSSVSALSLNGGVTTSSPKGLFFLSQPDKSIMESIYRFTVIVDDEMAFTDARYISTVATTKISSSMAHRMHRVTKKQPPPTVNVDIFLNAQEITQKPTNAAEHITQSFSPKEGAGRIFIGFKTSQTTGLAAHIAAPFVPTVEREAMDLQDSVLRLFNTELLEFAGILMRLVLENTMFHVIDTEWKNNSAAREKLELELENQRQQKITERKRRKASQSKLKQPNADTVEVTEENNDTSSGSLMSFAKYMAKGVKKKIVSVVNTVEEQLLDYDYGTQLLHPPDPRPLSDEELQAVLLMQAFCPRQSTPDPLVGTCLAQGFSRCMSTTPPVLTKSGVVQGDLARLACSGMETFVKQNVVRNVVFQNAEEYHTVIARVPRVNLEDLKTALADQILEESVLITFIQWWTKYSRIDVRGTSMAGPVLKEIIRFYSSSSNPINSNHNSNGKTNSPSDEKRIVIALKNFLFYVEKDSFLSNDPQLPLPESVLPRALGHKVGASYLSDTSLEQWFSPLPMEIWVEFISHHPAMNDAKPEGEGLRLQILSILAKEYGNRSPSEKVTWAGFCRTVLNERRCIPFDSVEPTKYAADKPADLYLYSAELKAFDGLSGSSFRKASMQLKSIGVSEEFLLHLGVRKSVSIDFLFANLHTLQWGHDPKPLIEYLRSATLTVQDLQKLQSTKYLPAEKEKTAATYAPSELYLPCPDLRIFPFIKILHWPTELEVSERSQNGRFLIQLGMKTLPPLSTILAHAASGFSKEDRAGRIACLDFLCARLGRHGPYHSQYQRIGPSQRRQYQMLPCIVQLPLSPDAPKKEEYHSPVSCYSNASCAIMGFPVIDPSLGETGKLYSNLFQCESEPPINMLLHQLKHIVALAKNQQKQDMSADKAKLVADTFSAIFTYLSHRSSEIRSTNFDAGDFIPIANKESLVWYSPDQVFFRRTGVNSEDGSITEDLFPVIEFSPFLSAVGVKQEATNKDIFRLMLENPNNVLKTLGSESKYRILLRRIAANPPFSHVTPKIRSSAFLLAYKFKSENGSKQNDQDSPSDASTYHLAKAEDIYIIDNSFFGRMFGVQRAPHESDLEDFYVQLGSNYISKSVDRRFEVVGSPSSNTKLTKALKDRIHQRGPLLVSPNVTSRPLVRGASSVLNENSLTFFQAANLMAVYSLDGVTRRNRTTCFSKKMGSVIGLKKQNALYIVDNFDWFDVGVAIGDLILERCQLEDAFFISSLLEAPLEQLRARGFPVDRILKPESPPEPPKPKPPPSPTPTIVKPPPNTQPAGPGTNGQPASPHYENTPPSAQTSKDDFLGILLQMFPDADKEFLRAALGKDPKLDDLQRVAEQMSGGNYPRGNDTASDAGTVDTSRSSQVGSDQNDTSSVPQKKKRLRKKLGKAFNGLRPSSFGGIMPPMNTGLGQCGGAVAGPATGSRHETRKPVTPASDAQAQEGLERMLQNTVDRSRNVNKQGVQSQATNVFSHMPEGLDRGDTCEVVPGQSLKPYLGASETGRTNNGILVFSWNADPSSEDFLNKNQDSLEHFSLVIGRLCEVYELQLSSVAIYHDPNGNAIAFNSNRALHFNIRYFHSLHFLPGKSHSHDCYSYWYVVMAHELAHHIVSAHNKEHGYYTESYTAKYLPKLVSLLKDL